MSAATGQLAEAVRESPGGEPTGVSTESVPRAAVRGVAWLGIGRVLEQVVAFGVFVLLGRLLEPAAFGLIAAASVIILLLRVFVGAGFARALVQREELIDDHVQTAFWTSMACGLGLALLTFAIAPLVADLFSQPRLTAVVRVLSVVFVLAALDSVPSALVDRSMRFRVQALRRFGATIAGSAAAVGLALGGAGVWALVAQILVVETVLVVMLWSMAGFRPRRRFSPTDFRELFAFGSHYMGIRLSLFLTQNLDNFLIGWVLGPVALGLYVVGYRVLIVFNELVTMTISQVALPTFARYQSDSERLRETFYGSISLGATAGWPVFAGLALLADQLVPFLFGDKWNGSVPVMRALALAGAVQVATIFMQNLVVAVGETRNEFRWNAGVTAAQIVGFAVTAHLGIVAVALSLGIVSAVLWPMRILQVARLTGISPRRYGAQLVGPALATALMAGAVIALRTALPTLPLGVSLAIEVLEGALMYLGLLPFVAPGAWARVFSALVLLRR